MRPGFRYDMNRATHAGPTHLTLRAVELPMKLAPFVPPSRANLTAPTLELIGA